MTNITSKTIIDVLDKLIGCTLPCGESNRDERILNNLRTLIDVTNWCMDGLLRSAEMRNSFEWSVKENGMLAFGAMLEYNKWLSEIIGEESES